MMNEGVSISRIQSYGSDDICKRCIHIYAYTDWVNEWMKLKN